MRPLFFLVFFLALLTAYPGHAQQTCQPCCQLRQMRIYHQGTWRTLNLKLWYRLNACEQPIRNRIVKRSVQEFVTRYPNGEDFWEVMNKNLLSYLIEKFPAITELEIEIAVVPDDMFTT